MSIALLHTRTAARSLASLGEDPTIPEQIAGAVVDAAMPAINARIPEVTQRFVDEAIPRIKGQLFELQPELDKLAITSAQAVLDDQQIQASIKGAVKEQADQARSQIRNALVATVGATLAGVLVIEMVEPWLPGRKRG